MDYSRTNPADNSQGGASKLYIFPFEQYSRSVITVEDNILTAFPSVTIYEVGAFNISFDESVTDFYEQKLSFQLKRILPTDKFKELAASDWRVILKDNNGNLRMLGLHTGLQGKFSKSTGVNRADFNGYNFSYETKEEGTAPFLTSLTNFNKEFYLQELLQYPI